MKRIILLGCTGSIGTQSVDVIRHHQDKFKIVAMACGSNIEMLETMTDMCDYFNVKNETDAKMLQIKYPDKHFTSGDDGILKLIENVECDLVINSLVGFLGLLPTLKAIEMKRDVALANKESLVAGGDLVLKALKEHNVNLYPIDSEHSAIFQCLQGNELKSVKKLIITASGGSFRDKSRDELVNVTVEDALNHPNWSMGKRITIDSSTMMNKGFEVIEAHYLFNIDYENIDVIINTQSIIHSMVEYTDKSFIAQLGTADMRLPIQYAINYPERIELFSDDELDLASIGHLDFRKMDYERFPLLALAFKAGQRAGNSGAILNAADEASVELFLNNEISYLDIEKFIFKAYENIPFIENVTLQDIIDTDKITRKYVYDLVRSKE